ncbi:helix-turn-helix domain-containing protein [Sulfitobacter sp. M22]|uniref:helix-turn-helix domain-containing protein n=1 Tax=Sulfitobacter sp. M22 TaxID=2675332 RepID=UPI001F22C43E|nr:helix-turn-helix transcriptional regulator [Sulfitobacter sp. M22]MCF7727110.1 helix-turn-helix domain-containing protein [Sulfitobacter sp. M22]
MIHSYFGSIQLINVKRLVESNRSRTLAGAAHTGTYLLFRKKLVESRKAANLSQAQLAKKLGKPPSYVAKYELGERRLDVIEMCVILKCINIDPYQFLTPIFEVAPTNLS